MITLVIIDRLRWKAYLIFMCTNLAVVPPVYFCYPVTANPALEEIDYLFTNPDKGAVKLSRELHKGGIVAHASKALCKRALVTAQVQQEGAPFILQWTNWTM